MLSYLLKLDLACHPHHALGSKSFCVIKFINSCNGTICVNTLNPYIKVLGLYYKATIKLWQRYAITSFQYTVQSTHIHTCTYNTYTHVYIKHTKYLYNTYIYEYIRTYIYKYIFFTLRFFFLKKILFPGTGYETFNFPSALQQDECARMLSCTTVWTSKCAVCYAERKLRTAP